ncbi:5-(carboxyamino)imidazole ribonucleotide synthase [Sphingomonas sp.]|uniref:5-(carboxyamino)imidazole ribonucleotide synthase n=1 Tax=Sphingomonas sp. TaxID=28214 RepID=UPI00286C0CD3|nr:5-(carboxyamino)imidazole ribonucleotide synthase [Sphingomonas sp.]
MIVPPGSTIGIIGGGQLGRMMALAAARLGYRCHIFDPHEAPCAAEVSAEFTRGAFDDEAALARFADACDVVTYEFENVPVGPIAALGDKLRPGTRSLEIAQDRAVEKRFLEGAGARVAAWREVGSVEQLDAAVAALGVPLVLKSRRLGYDGKGQAWVRDPAEARSAWDSIGNAPAVAEAGVAFEAEFSVLIARTHDGQTRAFPPPRNVHSDGILCHSTVPAGQPIEAMAETAIATAATLADALDHVGMFTVEFFACADGALVNEIAPRVHNSGHWTIEGAVTSQFEQHVRAICGLALGSADLVADGAVMDNLIGGDVDAWAAILAAPDASLHLYHKGEARPGRKMGHVTRLK